jgi:hypothetical protein
MEKQWIHVKVMVESLLLLEQIDKLTLATNTNMEKYFFLWKIKRIWKSSNKILQILAFLEHSAILGSLMHVSWAHGVLKPPICLRDRNSARSTSFLGHWLPTDKNSVHSRMGSFGPANVAPVVSCRWFSNATGRDSVLYTGPRGSSYLTLQYAPS